jgi:hypothetical protein
VCRNLLNLATYFIISLLIVKSASSIVCVALSASKQRTLISCWCRFTRIGDEFIRVTQKLITKPLKIVAKLKKLGINITNKITLKSTTFCHMALCNPAKVYGQFGRVYFRHLIFLVHSQILKIEGISFCEYFVNICRTLWRQISVGDNILAIFTTTIKRTRIHSSLFT